MIEYKDDKLLLKYLFNLTGSYKDLDKKIKNIKLPDSLKLEIETIKTIESFGQKILGKKIQILGNIPFKKKISYKDIINFGKLLKI